MSTELREGDSIIQQHGPFKSTWIVTKILDAGAVLAYNGDVRFTGYDHTINAPDGTPLTTYTTESFLGRAHWGGAKVVANS